MSKNTKSCNIIQKTIFKSYPYYLVLIDKYFRNFIIKN